MTQVDFTISDLTSHVSTVEYHGYTDQALNNVDPADFSDYNADFNGPVPKKSTHSIALCVVKLCFVLNNKHRLNTITYNIQYIYRTKLECVKIKK